MINGCKNQLNLRYLQNNNKDDKRVFPVPDLQFTDEYLQRKE